jgi:pSer/pThr/pTyr-binding forkhead associated (FHA) protein
VAFGRLRVIQGGSDNRLHPNAVLSLQPETTLGSQTDNDLVVLDRYISGHHARLRWDGVNWWLDDLNSTNGTYVNRQRVTAGGSVVLAAGSLISVGDAAFELLE